jgi:outer membrane lipoprotein-sorting protein
MKRIVTHAVCVIGLLLPCGCATAPRASFSHQPGVVVNTLSASASLSISKGEQGMGSSGYLLYQRPDRMRLVILSPFGTTLMEVIVNGDRITIIDNSNGAAFSGALDDLPRAGQGETWRQARWVLDMDPPGVFAGDGSQERVNGSGERERVTFENGLVISKSLANGDMVRYRDYETVNGVPLATEIIMDNHDGGRFRIKLSEPEVNADLAPDAFVPRLDGLQLYPLALLQGR